MGPALIHESVNLRHPVRGKEPQPGIRHFRQLEVGPDFILPSYPGAELEMIEFRGRSAVKLSEKLPEILPPVG